MRAITYGTQHRHSTTVHYLVAVCMLCNISARRNIKELMKDRCLWAVVPSCRPDVLFLFLISLVWQNLIFFCFFVVNLDFSFKFSSVELSHQVK